MNIWRYGDNIDTDMLFPGKYVYNCSNAEEIKPHLLEDLDPSFSKASGLPGLGLYVPPGEIYRSGDYESFLRPF